MKDLVFRLAVYECEIVAGDDGDPAFRPIGGVMHYSTGVISGLTTPHPEAFVSLVELRTANMGRAAAQAILEQSRS